MVTASAEAPNLLIFDRRTTVENILQRIRAAFNVLMGRTSAQPPSSTSQDQEERGPSDEIGKDSDIDDRDRAMRWIVFILSILTVLFVGTYLGVWLFGFLGGVVGLALSAGLMTLLSKQFILKVPQAQVFVTLNTLRPFFGLPGDANVKYGPGDHVTYPWEDRDEKGNLSLDIITLDFKEEVPGKDTMLIITGSMQFRVDIKLAERFVAVDQSTVTGGIIDLIKASISGRLAEMSGDNAKKEIVTMNEALLAEFGLPSQMPRAGQDTGAQAPETTVKKSSQVSHLELKYGIEIIKVTVSGIDFPPKVQATRDARDQAAQVLRGVATMYGLDEEELRRKRQSNEIDSTEYNEMVDRFLASAGTAEMKINAIKGLDVPKIAKRVAGTFGITGKE